MKNKLQYTEESLPDLKWQKLGIENTNSVCTPTQPAEVGAKLSSSKPPCQKLHSIQNTGHSLEADDTELHIESQA